MIWYVMLFGVLAMFVVWETCVFIHELTPRDRLVWAQATALGAELRPFILPAILAQYLTLATGLPLWLAALAPTTELIIWFPARHLPDDDRWRRRRRRVGDRIRQLVARLVVATR